MEETLSAHAKRALRTKVRARVTAVLDAGIALLQRLRRKVGGVQDAEEGEDRPGSRRDQPRERGRTATPEPVAEVPKPRRRLRAFLITLGVLLLGGVAGGAVAYIQFQKQLGVQLQEKQRLQAELAKKTRPTGETAKAFEQEQLRRARAEEKLAASLAEYAESTGHSYALLETLFGQQLAESRRMEAALTENAKSSAEARKALEEEQAKRTEAEEKLASSLTEHSKSTTEKQKQLDAAEKQLGAAEKQLAKLLAGEDMRSGQREPPASRRSGGNRPSRPTKSAKCTLDTKNVDSLKSCIDDFNR